MHRSNQTFERDSFQASFCSSAKGIRGTLRPDFTVVREQFIFSHLNDQDHLHSSELGVNLKSIKRLDVASLKYRESGASWELPPHAHRTAGSAGKRLSKPATRSGTSEGTIFP
jgi:hypothetical protein